MKKIITIIVSVLLCIGAIGGSFALAKHLDENPPTSVENNSSKDEADDTNESETKLVKVWEICTDEADLAVGDQIVLVASSNERALSMTQNSNNRAATKIVKEDDSITINDDVQIITLEEGVVENTFAFNVGDGYLYAPSSASNHLKTKAAIDPNGSWSITIDEGAIANIVAQGESAINVLQYNSNNHIFSCYTSTQEAILIYKLVEREIEL
jgi:hypothetical protein